jgi:cell division protein FtsN
MTKKERAMPAVDAVIVAAIIAAFVIFAAVLTWAEHRTKNLSTVRSAAKLAGNAPPHA